MQQFTDEKIEGLKVNIEKAKQGVSVDDEDILQYFECELEELTGEYQVYDE